MLYCRLPAETFMDNLADAHLALSLFHYISIFIKDIPVRPADLKIEVGHVIINDLRGAAGFSDKVCVDPSDDLVFVVMDKVQGVKDIVRVVLREDRFKIILILADGGGFGGGI